MPSYLVKVKKKMSLYAKRRSRNILDGEYGSVFKGRSMDFDDLRNYQFGDDCKDIDWKATARSGSALIRRYVAIRKHNIMIVADIGRSMAATAPGRESKQEIALFVAGVMAYIVQKHGDLIGLVAGDSQRIKRYPLKESTSHIEGMLNTYNDAISVEAPASSITSVLEYILRSYRERMFLVVITDPAGALSVDDALIKKVQVRHEQIYVVVNDSIVSDEELVHDDIYDIDDRSSVPSFIRGNKKFRESEQQNNAVIKEAVARKFAGKGVISGFVEREADVVNDIIKLLERQRYARHR